MKTRLMVLVAIGILATGCQKKHEDGSPVQTGGLMGGGVTSTAHYAGAITPVFPCGTGVCRQTIPTTANVIDFPADAIRVYLCRNADCSAGLPAHQCSEVWDQPAAPCYTSTPSPNIVFGKYVVQFINANQGYTIAPSTVIPGFITYTIDTVVTR